MKTQSLPLTMKLMIAFLAATLVCSFAITRVNAAGSDNDGIIEAGEIIHDDIFLNADVVRMDGEVLGNVVATGDTITINGKITGDAFLFGREVIIGENAIIAGNLISGAQTIKVAGKINQSLIIGGSSLVLASGAQIDRNVYFGGYNLETETDTLIGVDLLSGSYQILLNGQIGRDVNSGAAAVEINGKVNGSVTLEMGNVETNPVQFPSIPGVDVTYQPGLRIGQDAVIGGDLKYTISNDQSAGILAQPGGQTIFQTPVPSTNVGTSQKPQDQDNPALRFGRFIWGWFKTFWGNLVSLGILGLFLVRFLPKQLSLAQTKLKEQPLLAAGFGILTVILGYAGLMLLGLALLAVGILIAMITTGGLNTVVFGLGFAGLGFSWALFTVVVIYVSKLVVCTLFGSWILAKLAPESPAAENPVWGMLLGVLIYSVLRVVPLFGWLLAGLVILFGLGAIWLMYRNPVQTAS